MGKQAQNASTVAARWASRAAGAKTEYVDGAMRVTEAPTKKAAAQVDRYADGCARAAADGSFAEGCLAVSLSDWQSSISGKGAANYVTGVRAGEGRMQQFLTAYLPVAQQISDQVATMPKGDRAAAIARIEKMLDMNEQFRASRGRRRMAA